jgi:competence protein ComEC
MKKAVIYSLIIFVALIGFVIFENYKFRGSDLRLVMCDVGQGEAIFITTPAGTQILIDGGPGKAVLKCLSDNMPFWDRSLDLVILTHPHADHHTGLIDVVERYSLREFYTQDVKSSSEGFKLLEAKLAAKNMSAKYLNRGDNLKDESGLVLKILSPSSAELEKYDQNSAYVDLNESSIIALLRFGNFSALLTGDAEESAVKQAFSPGMKVKVFKVPHHGSRGAVSEELLSMTRPDVALISVGEGNKFGHPAWDTLSLLEKYGVKNF